MSEFTTGDIEKFIAGPSRFGGEHDWDNFLHHLRANPDKGVWLPHVGMAYLEGESNTSWDSDDPSYFVFRINSWNGNRFFRVESESSSFGSPGHGDITEVQETTKTIRSWEGI